jgi:hypothetical protein
MNVMTEEEARGKWCPFARVQQYHGAANRALLPKDVDYSTCLASQCMAWRWGRLEDPDFWDGDADPPQGQGWERHPDRDKTWVRWPPRRGRCGLAGSSTP